MLYFNCIIFIYSIFFSKDLARRVALTTGVDLVKWRLPIVCIHRDGIRFALQDYENNEEEESVDEVPSPQQLDFLEVLSEFSFRLLPVDRVGEKGMSVIIIILYSRKYLLASGANIHKSTEYSLEQMFINLQNLIHYN